MIRKYHNHKLQTTNFEEYSNNVVSYRIITHLTVEYVMKFLRLRKYVDPYGIKKSIFSKYAHKLVY